jgi:hypothetical protein
VQSICKEFHVYFRGMADKLSTRVARSYTFTFETLEEKTAMLSHAKKRGLTLASLIKSLLAKDLESKEAPAPPRS